MLSASDGMSVHEACRKAQLLMLKEDKKKKRGTAPSADNSNFTRLFNISRRALRYE